MGLRAGIPFPSFSIRWGNSRRHGCRDMSAQLRNGGCLTSFPAPPSFPCPFPSDTLHNADWVACIASCYCQGSSKQSNKRLKLHPHQPVEPLHLQRCRLPKRRGKETSPKVIAWDAINFVSHGGVKQWELYLLEVSQRHFLTAFEITAHEIARRLREALWGQKVNLTHGLIAGFNSPHLFAHLWLFMCWLISNYQCWVISSPGGTVFFFFLWKFGLTWQLVCFPGFRRAADFPYILKAKLHQVPPPNRDFKNLIHC